MGLTLSVPYKPQFPDFGKADLGQTPGPTMPISSNTALFGPLHTSSNPAPFNCKEVINAVIRKHESDIKELERLASIVERSLSQARQHRAVLGKALAPIESVPPEILSEIFSWVKAMMAASPDAQEAAGCQFAIRLYNVSRVWRFVAQGQSSLWSRVENRDFWKGLSPVVWFDRARYQPLHLTVTITRRQPPKQWISLLRLIRVKAPQWNSIRVVDDPEALSLDESIALNQDLLSFLLDSNRLLLNLVTFSISASCLVAYPTPDIFPENSGDLSVQMPKLRHLHLRNILFNNMQAVMAPLVTLSLQSGEYFRDQWIACLKACTSLEVLILHDVILHENLEEVTSEEDPCIHLPSLTSLVLDKLNTTMIDFVFDNFHPPALQVLALSFGEQEEEDDLEDLMLFESVGRLPILLDRCLDLTSLAFEGAARCVSKGLQSLTRAHVLSRHLQYLYVGAAGLSTLEEAEAHQEVVSVYYSIRALIEHRAICLNLDHDRANLPQELLWNKIMELQCIVKALRELVLVGELGKVYDTIAKGPGEAWFNDRIKDGVRRSNKGLVKSIEMV